MLGIECSSRKIPLFLISENFKKKKDICKDVHHKPSFPFFPTPFIPESLKFELESKKRFF